MTPKKLVLMVEGQSEESSLPGLITRILKDVNGQDVLYVSTTMRVGELHGLVNRGSEAEWIRFLNSAAKKDHLGAVLLLLDGDAKARNGIDTSEGKKTFCARETASFLARRARKETVAGKAFSLAIVFARQELESWLLAGCPEFAVRIDRSGKDLERAPRDAKGEISALRKRPYKETTHQPELTRKLDFARVRPKMRSFRRLENAIRQLVDAVRGGTPVCTP